MIRQTYGAKELKEVLGCSESKAYELIRIMNIELQKKGFLTLRGKVPAAYRGVPASGTSHRTDEFSGGANMNYVEPIRDGTTVRDIGDYLKGIHEKYYIMYMIGIYSGLRISDILKLKIRDVKGRDKIRIREKKTGKEKMFPVNKELAAALDDYCAGKKDYEYVVPGARAVDKAVSREYAYKVIHEAGEQFGLDNLGTHTMRKTFGYHFYVQTKDIVLLMRIFNHHDESKTLRYIGIEQTTIDKAMLKFSYKNR